MRNRVRITETKFHVDTTNKVVVCELECDMQMHKHPAWPIIDSTMWKKKFPNVSYDGEFTVKAKARCNASDTFDETIGKRIAESRAKTKMFKTASKVWRLCSEELSKLSKQCALSAASCIDSMFIEHKHVKELVQE